MKIERVNEHTLKFFITYVDMEKRGFGRDEIWYNRERGEELFWEMMDEAHDEEQFSLDGPLWIQVQAFEKGLEIVVTRAQLSNDGSKLELPISDEKRIDIPVDVQMENDMEQSPHFSQQRRKRLPAPEEDREPGFLVRFKEFEDIVQLSHVFPVKDVLTTLYHYENEYLLYTVFEESEEENDENQQADWLSVLLEYGFETNLTVYRLDEYGKRILKDNALETLRNQFPVNPNQSGS